MTPDMAVKAVNWYADFQRQSGKMKMEVHFFGGEPFVCRETVEAAVHRSRLLADKYGLEPHLEASTNGLFEPAYAQFAGDYFQAVVLSIDGFEDSHNRHRPAGPGLGSFSAARRSAAVLARSETQLCLRCCVSQLNCGRLEETAVWFSEEFQPAYINFEPLTVNDRTRAASLEPPDPYEFAGSFCRARALAAGFGVKAVYAASDGEPWQASFCPVGRDALIVSPDGRVSGCYLPRETWRAHGLDLDLGRLSEAGEMELDPHAVFRLRRLARDKPGCARCFCRPVCSGGCHVHHSCQGSSAHYDHFCIQTRLITAAGLLEDLGLEEAARAFWEDRRAMEELALQPSDLLEDAF
jgi:uncharacterized protein